jgi:hypothetical protein
VQEGDRPSPPRSPSLSCCLFTSPAPCGDCFSWPTHVCRVQASLSSSLLSKVGAGLLEGILYLPGSLSWCHCLDSVARPFIAGAHGGLVPLGQHRCCVMVFVSPHWQTQNCCFFFSHEHTLHPLNHVRCWVSPSMIPASPEAKQRNPGHRVLWALQWEEAIPGVTVTFTTPVDF